MSQIVWLASYPKSGNTWVRALLTNYRRADGTDPNINALEGGAIGVERETIDDCLGVDSSLLTVEQLARYRASVYECLAARSAQDPLLIKLHDAYLAPEGQAPPFGTPAARSAVYIVRDPLDVVVSYAHHRNRMIDDTIRVMADPRAFLDGTDRPGAHVPQLVSSWSRHVESWLGQRSVPTLTIRYEDLTAAPSDVLCNIVRFLGWPVDPERVNHAVQASTFDRLRDQEARVGFIEKQPTAQSFFRRGQVGSWRDALSIDQVRRICQDHAAVMAELGYLVYQPSMTGLSELAVIARTDSVLSSDLNEGVVLMDLERVAYYALEKAAARLWQLTEQPIMIQALCRQLVMEYDITAPDCQRAVLAFVEDLCERGVLRVVEPTP